MAALEAAAADGSRRRREADQRAAIAAANIADPVYEQWVDAARAADLNRYRGEIFAIEEQERIHALENAQRAAAAAEAAAAAALAAAALIRQQRDNNPEAAAWDRATQIPIPGGRRHRKTRKHSRKHTKKNRKVSRRKMTRRR